jgi:hypothetical protein
MRAGTYPVAPMAQTAPPGRTWKVNADSEIGTGASRRARARREPQQCRRRRRSSGIIMLDRIVTKDVAFTGRSRERAGARRAASSRSSKTGAATMPVTKVLTAGIGEADLRDIKVYRERGGYKQWERAVRELSRIDVLEAWR